MECEVCGKSATRFFFISRHRRLCDQHEVEWSKWFKKHGGNGTNWALEFKKFVQASKEALG